ncbi:MAG: MarR family transcriptional regulator [Coriobacteriaceae bacterium]|nr:MarR family transcriptional regulator [Coriobacteriaceae bacterium]
MIAEFNREGGIPHNMSTTFHEDAPNPADTPAEARVRKILELLGFCGQFLHFNGGGRSGQASILCMIAKNGNEISQQELRLHFELKPGSLSEILSKMEMAGLIERTKNPEDRRQLFVRLTPEGAGRARREQEKRVAFRREAFAALSEEEQDQLLSSLKKVRATWKELHD